MQGRTVSEETPAATTVDTGSEPEGKEQSVQPGAESAPAAKDAGENERINELTRNWRETQRDRDYWRDLALRGQTTVDRDEPNHRRTDEPSDPELKTLADFDFDEKAYGKYVLDVARETARREAEALRKELRESRTREERELARAEFADRAEAWAKEQQVDDYDVMFAHPRDGGPIVTEAMAETIIESENGHALLYHLAKNRALAARIARLPPLQQARELGRLEAKLAKPATNQVSNAPPPAPTVSGASDTGAKKDPEKMTDQEWWAARQRSRRHK